MPQLIPFVTVLGPRQSGKTTLVRSLFGDYDYVSLETPDSRDFALEDPRGFLNQFSGGVVLDEVQRAPDLLSYIQDIVDARDEPGQFVLTGSQNFLLLEQVTQSLAGRTAVFHLLPFSRAELLKAYLNRGTDPDVHFWRDSAGHEVDLIIGQGNELIPVEIKSGETVAGDFFKGLEYWRSLPGQEDCPPVLVFGGEKSVRRRGTMVYSWRHWP